MRKLFSMLLTLVCATGVAIAGNIEASTVLPTEGRPNHLYTMMSGAGTYASPTTTPLSGDSEKGLFAFYPVENVDGAYYIYSHNAKKWLSYTKADSYSGVKGFITLSSTKVEDTYFQVNNYSENSYEISPYKADNTVASIYLNWYQGVSANTDITLGLWTTGGAGDSGSSFTFEEVVIVDRVYTITVPADVTLTIAGTQYTTGSTLTVEGSFNKSTATVVAPEGKFAVISVNDTENTIIVSTATLPQQDTSAPYTNAVLYPAQQDAVGTASISSSNDVYTLSNNVLAASWMKVGDALYFAGAKAMDLVAGTEPFTVAFGSGDNVPASAMTLVSVTTENLTGKSDAVGGAEHYDGVQLVANYTYTYNESDIEIVWRAVLRDGSHYIRTEMDLKGVDDVDMFNIIPMIYNVDTKAAGSTPAVVGNTRGAVLMSNKIFAGLETPTAYNTVGDASGEEDSYDLTTSMDPIALTKDSWLQVAEGEVPKRVEEATGANYPNVYAYTTANDITLTEGQKVEITVEYVSGANRLDLGGAVLLDASNAIAAVDYHSGYAGSSTQNNTFTFNAPYDGTFSIRVFIQNTTEAITANSNITIKIYTPKEGVVINTDIVGIQGRWSRNTTLAQGEIWKVGAVVGLVAQDGSQTDEDIHKTQKRRSFLAYSERERAVPWRAFTHYNSWYELNINRNNAAPGSEHTNFTSEDIEDVINHWKTDFYERYEQAPVAFVIDDGWDNYGPWTFHSGFPEEMRPMVQLAKDMGAGVGAWLGPVGGYGQSGNYRRAYWNDENRGGMQLSNPAYYETFLTAANNLVSNQDGVEGFNRETDNYLFFKFDGISAQFSAVGPDAGDTGNENAEGIIRLERYVREELREDIFFNTTVGTWASPFWYQISDATWRQENDHDHIGNNSINRENWITYRDRLVYQNYVTNSPICPINTLMTHGFILTEFGPPASDVRDYDAVLREMRCAFVCGSGVVELYTDYKLLNSINDGQLWADIAECMAWQKRNADVLPDAHWVGGSPWNGSSHEVYGWASWNGTKSTLALRNGGNDEQTYTFTLREALNIPANVNGSIILRKSFNNQDALTGFTEGEAINIDDELTVTLPGSSLFCFDGIDATATVQLVESITLKAENESLELPMNETMVVLAALNSSAAYPVLEWTTSDASIATVRNGLVLPVAEGEVTITATAKDGSNKSASVTITVTPDPTIPTIDTTKKYYIKEVNSGLYLTADNYDAHVQGSKGGVNVVEKSTEKVADQVFTLTAAEGDSKFYLETASGYYIYCQGWNVDALATKSAIEFVESGENIYQLKKNDTEYFKVQEVDGVTYPFCDAAESAAAQWTLEEYVPELTLEEVGNPTEDGVYRIFWKKDGRGYLAYHNDYPEKGVLADVTLGSYGSSHFNSETDPVELEWYLITSERTGNKYLFNASNGKFLTYSDRSANAAIASLLDAASPCPITIEENTSYSGNYIIKANVNGTERLLSSGCGTASATGDPVRWNSIDQMADGGSPLIFVKVTGAIVSQRIIDEAKLAIEDYENPAERDVVFEWTTSTAWTAVEDYTSAVLNDNALSNGVKYFDCGNITIEGARTITSTFAYIDGGHKLNMRGIEIIDENNNIVAGDYHVGTAGGSLVDNIYTVKVAEPGTYTVRCYATEGGGDQFNMSHGSITVSFEVEEAQNFTENVTFVAEFATLHLGYKVAVPAGVEAYAVSEVEDWAMLAPIENVIPAATPVILRNVGDATSYDFSYTSDEAPTVEKNLLKGSIVDRYVAEDAFVLSLYDNEIGLYKATLNQLDNTAFFNNANRAYLPAADELKAIFYAFNFDWNGTTGIEGVEAAEDNLKNASYDLTGRKIKQITAPGIYIINGEKCVVK